MTGEYATHFGKWFAMYSNDSVSAQAEAAGLSVRFGRHLFVLGHLDYRIKDARSWPKWLRFRIVFWRPQQ